MAWENKSQYKWKRSRNAHVKYEVVTRKEIAGIVLTSLRNDTESKLAAMDEIIVSLFVNWRVYTLIIEQIKKKKLKKTCVKHCFLRVS